MARTKNSLAAIVLFIVFSASSSILVQADEEEDFKTSTDLQLQLSSLPEAKFRFIQSFIFPFLKGSGPLTKDNNITVLVSADVSPISLAATGELIWEPAAFFLLSGGGYTGSGWNMPLGYGIGINAPKEKSDTPHNTPDPPREAKIFGKAFDGLIWNTWGAATLQFDLEAVIPGDWTHVLFQTRQEFRYSAYTRAAKSEAWVMENDDRNNLNGWNYYANYVLGYRMPLSPLLNTIAVMAELNKSLYDTPGGAYWGENLGQWIFSTLFNFSVTSRFTTALVIQMRTRPNYGTSNFDNYDYYYQDLEIQNQGGNRRLLFYRAAVILNYKIY